MNQFIVRNYFADSVLHERAMTHDESETESKMVKVFIHRERIW